MRRISRPAVRENVSRNSGSWYFVGRSWENVFTATNGLRISWTRPAAMASIEAKRSARRFSCSSSFKCEMSLTAATAPTSWPGRSGQGRGRAHEGDELAGRVGQRELDLGARLAIRKRPPEAPGQGRRELLHPLAFRRDRRHANQPLGRAVEEHYPGLGSDGHDSALYRAQDRLKLLIKLHHALVSLRVSDRDRRLIRERRKQISIITEVWVVKWFWTKR